MAGPCCSHPGADLGFLVGALFIIAAVLVRGVEGQGPALVQAQFTGGWSSWRLPSSPCSRNPWSATCSCYWQPPSPSRSSVWFSATP